MNELKIVFFFFHVDIELQEIIKLGMCGCSNNFFLILAEHKTTNKQTNETIVLGVNKIII